MDSNKYAGLSFQVDTNIQGVIGRIFKLAQCNLGTL